MLVPDFGMRMLICRVVMPSSITTSYLCAQVVAATLYFTCMLGVEPQVQPNSSAPLLRTEADRTEWIVKEVDLCCRSYEYSKVIDGELAQVRARLL